MVTKSVDGERFVSKKVKFDGANVRRKYGRGVPPKFSLRGVGKPLISGNLRTLALLFGVSFVPERCRLDRIFYHKNSTKSHAESK
jgi:hypothetical protein